MPESRADREILSTLAEHLPETVLRELIPHVEPITVRQLLARLGGVNLPQEPLAQQPLFPQNPSQAGISCRLYTDGASRGNPGEAGAGAVLISPEGEELGTRSLYLGQQTNNVAEYYALIAGLELAEQLGCNDLQIFLDSELIVRQIKGVYKVKNVHLKPLFAKVGSHLAKIDTWEIHHVPRAENARADELANQGIDDNK